MDITTLGYVIWSDSLANYIGDEMMYQYQCEVLSWCIGVDIVLIIIAVLVLTIDYCKLNQIKPFMGKKQEDMFR